MAVASLPTTHHHSLTFPPRFSSFKKSSETLIFPSIHKYTCLCKSNVGLLISSTSSNSVSRRSFKSKSKTIDANEHDQIQIDEKNLNGEVKQKYISTMKALIPVYKEAILNADEKAISDIEAVICIKEQEKNDLVQKVAALSADVASRKNKYIHLSADFENFRKRSEKDFLSVTSNAKVYAMERLLPMVDSFERTKQQNTAETEKEKKIVTSYQGIYKQFVETMRSLSVAVVATVGKPFDPTSLRGSLEIEIVRHTRWLSSIAEGIEAAYKLHVHIVVGETPRTSSLLHEAIAREESKEFKEGIIVQEIRRGFLLGDRVLRPARVKVSAGPGRHKSSANEETGGQATAAAGIDDSALPNR